MDFQQWIENNKILKNFVDETMDDNSPISACVTATIVQFIMNTRRGLNLIARENDGMVSATDIYNVQIEELRHCIIDLSKKLEIKSQYMETLQ